MAQPVARTSSMLRATSISGDAHHEAAAMDVQQRARPRRAVRGLNSRQRMRRRGRPSRRERCTSSMRTSAWRGRIGPHRHDPPWPGGNRARFSAYDDRWAERHPPAAAAPDPHPCLSVAVISFLLSAHAASPVKATGLVGQPKRRSVGSKATQYPKQSSGGSTVRSTSWVGDTLDGAGAMVAARARRRGCSAS